MPRFIKKGQYWYISSGDIYICIFWVRAVLLRANGFVWPADPLLWEKEDPWHDSLHHKGNFWGMAFSRNRYYMHMRFKRKMGLVGFTQVLSYLNSERVLFIFISFSHFGNLTLWAHFLCERWAHFPSFVSTFQEPRRGWEVGKVTMVWGSCWYEEITLIMLVRLT